MRIEYFPSDIIDNTGIVLITLI